jgi:pimeloyl-ACP methyl ester carboxylesterase
MKTRVGISFATALLFGASACTQVLVPATPAVQPVPEIDWKPCGLAPPAEYQERAARMECGVLQVPLDYAAPEGEKAQLLVIKAPATGEKAGSIVTNPGGPGDSGAQNLINHYLVGDLDALNARYDLVSFDPRGVGSSLPAVKCLDAAEADAYLQLDHTPQTEEEIQVFADGERKFNEACQANSASILPYVGTVSVAKDLDQLRQAVGDEKLNYLGTSYGTWLGAEYANQFPASVGKMVLDSAVDPSISQMTLDLEQAASQEANLNALLDDCVSQASQCALYSFGTTRDQLREKIIGFSAQLDQEPMTVGDRKLSKQMFDEALGSGVGAASLRAQLPGMLAAAFNGDATEILSVADLVTRRQDDGTFGNIDEANRAVRCADDTSHYSVDDVKAQLEQYRAAAPIFGEGAAWDGLRCLDWPVPGDNAAKDVAAPNSANTIVVIGSTGDPATPFAWSPALASQLGNAQLITNNGPFHGAYMAKETCVREKIDTFFLDGTLPGNVTCE